MNDDELTVYWCRKYGPKINLGAVIRGAIDWVRADQSKAEQERDSALKRMGELEAERDLSLATASQAVGQMANACAVADGLRGENASLKAQLEEARKDIARLSGHESLIIYDRLSEENAFLRKRVDELQSMDTKDAQELARTNDALRFQLERNENLMKDLQEALDRALALKHERDSALMEQAHSEAMLMVVESRLSDRNAENNSLRQKNGSLKSIVERSGRREWMGHEAGMVRKANSARQEASHFKGQIASLQFALESKGKERDSALAREQAALADAARSDEIVKYIKATMQVYREQEAERGYIGTPGGLEHMGDVWRKFIEWDKALSSSPSSWLAGVKAEAFERGFCAGACPEPQTPKCKELCGLLKAAQAARGEGA